MADEFMSRVMDVKFWILIVVSPTSIICSGLVILYFYRQRQTITIHHHLIFVLIIISILQVTTAHPFDMIFYHYRVVLFESSAFCAWWNWWEYSLFAMSMIVMAWGSTERHILIFNSSVMSTKRKRLFLHYLPMAFAFFYPLLFYIFAIFLYPCENYWSYDNILCLQPCYLYGPPVLVLYDYLTNNALPVIIVALSNAVLVARVLWQKRHRQEAWRRHRKLTIHLLTIATLYTIFCLPLAINGMIFSFTVAPFSLELHAIYFFFPATLMITLVPFISIPFLPNFRRVIFNRRQTSVIPEENPAQRVPNVNTSKSPMPNISL